MISRSSKQCYVARLAHPFRVGGLYQVLVLVLLQFTNATGRRYESEHDVSHHQILPPTGVLQ